MDQNRVFLGQSTVIRLCLPVDPLIMLPHIKDDKNNLNDRRYTVGGLDQKQIIRNHQKNQLNRLEMTIVTIARDVTTYFFPSTSRNALYFPRSENSTIPGTPYNRMMQQTVK